MLSEIKAITAHYLSENGRLELFQAVIPLMLKVTGQVLGIILFIKLMVRLIIPETGQLSGQGLSEVVTVQLIIRETMLLLAHMRLRRATAMIPEMVILSLPVKI